MTILTKEQWEAKYGKDDWLDNGLLIMPGPKRQSSLKMASPSTSAASADDPMAGAISMMEAALRAKDTQVMTKQSNTPSAPPEPANRV
jgi:hypothetical protein